MWKRMLENSNDNAKIIKMCKKLDQNSVQEIFKNADILTSESALCKNSHIWFLGIEECFKNSEYKELLQLIFNEAPWIFQLKDSKGNSLFELGNAYNPNFEQDLKNQALKVQGVNSVSNQAQVHPEHQDGNNPSISSFDVEFSQTNLSGASGNIEGKDE